MKPQTLRAGLAQLTARHLQRRRRTVTAIESDSGPAVVVDGQRLVNFCGNDYLGLNSHPVTGHGLEHERLEEELAQFTGRARALLFSTGYMANLAAITCLAERDGRVVMDRLCHASLIDAARLSGAQLKRFAHADDGAAGVMLDRSGTGADLLVTDGVFSMDGDLAPLPQLAQLAAARDACLIVDDAH